MSLTSKFVGGPSSGGGGGTPPNLINFLVASWSFDADPYVARIVHPDFDLVKTNTPTFIAGGKLAGCVQLANGNNALHTSAQAASVLNFSGFTEFSLTFWFRFLTDPNGDAAVPVSKSGGVTGYTVVTGAFYDIAWQVWQGSAVLKSVIWIPALDLDTWYFVSVQCKNDDFIYMRVCDEFTFPAQQTTAFGTYVPNTTAEFKVGASSSGGLTYVVDELNLWSIKLTEAEERWVWADGVGRTGILFA